MIFKGGNNYGSCNFSSENVRFLAAELSILFLVISFFVGVLQEYLPPKKIEAILGSKNGKGYFISALLGSITPFCSCSTIPFLKGLMKANAGFGPMMVFLFASPLLNPLIIGLMFATFGIKITVFYFAAAMTVSIIAGYVLEKLGFEKYIKESQDTKAESCCGPKEEVKEEASCCTAKPAEVLAKESCCDKKEEPKVEAAGGSCCAATTAAVEVKVDSKWKKIWNLAWGDFKDALPYLLLGIAIGSLIYGFIPTEFIAKYASGESWWAVPIAAVIGIPLYIRAEAVIPLSAALMAKGMALGPLMALIIGSAGASLTEVILLKSLFKNKLIAAFLFVVLTMAVGSGWVLTYFS